MYFQLLDIAIDVFKNKGNPDLDIPVSLSCFGPLPRACSYVFKLYAF